MAAVARAAGLSRPALYQYFANRADLFRGAFEVVLEDATDAALAALAADGSVAERFDRYLQRLSGDGYEMLAATPFGSELMEARLDFAADVADHATRRARRGLQAYVGRCDAPDDSTRRAAIDLLVLAPAGLKGDAPSPAVYRRRLTALADAAAAMLAAGR